MTQVIGQHFDLSPEHNQLVEKFSQAMSADDIQLYYQIVLNGRKDLPYAADEQAAFDMLLLRLLAFTPIKNGQSLPETLVNQPSDFDEVQFDETNIDKADVTLASIKIAPVTENASEATQIIAPHPEAIISIDKTEIKVQEEIDNPIAEPEIVSNANVLSAPDYINTSTNTVEHNSAIPESVTERSTWLSAAKWTMALWPGTDAKRASASRISPWMKLNRLDSDTELRFVSVPE